MLLVTALPSSAVLSLAPGAQEVCLPAGESRAGAWMVRNAGMETTRVTVVVTAYEEYSAGRTAPSPVGWLRLDPDSFELAPGAHRSVNWLALLPDSTQPERIAMVFFAEEARPGLAAVQSRIGVAFYALASGAVAPGFGGIDVRPDRAPDGRWRFVAEVENAGNVHLRPRGRIEILDGSGVSVAAARWEPGLPVFPSRRERYVSHATSLPLPAGSYAARWRLETPAIDGTSGPSMSGETNFEVP